MAPSKYSNNPLRQQSTKRRERRPLVWAYVRHRSTKADKTTNYRSNRVTYRMVRACPLLSYKPHNTSQLRLRSKIGWVETPSRFFSPHMLSLRTAETAKTLSHRKKYFPFTDCSGCSWLYESNCVRKFIMMMMMMMMMITSHINFLLL